MSCAVPRPIFGASAIITAPVFTKPSVSFKSVIMWSGWTISPPSMYFACASAPAL